MPESKDLASAALKVMSGEKTGGLSIVSRFFLSIIEHIYAAIIRLRYFLYRSGIWKTHKVAAPVLCIGNISTGGTGKTPTVEWLARCITTKYQKKVAVLSRGYKTHNVFDKNEKLIELNDESLMLQENVPNAVLVQNPKRYLAAIDALDTHNAEVLILDDGYQHIQFHRDLDIVLIDSLLPFGFGHMLPRGLLREPLSGLKRASAIVLTRANQANADELLALRETISELAPGVPIASSQHAPIALENIVTGEPLPLEAIRDKKVWLISGIGHPAAFRSTVKHLGATVLYHSAMPDHYLFTEADIDGFSNGKLSTAIDYFVVTQKDAVKLKRMFTLNTPVPVLSLKIEIQFLSGEKEIQTLIHSTLQNHAHD